MQINDTTDMTRIVPVIFCSYTSYPGKKQEKQKFSKMKVIIYFLLL